jgi:DNA-binding transcriptional MerR regulator
VADSGRDDGEGRPEGFLKISELAKRAGVGRGAIQHYLREGLLPPPKKTSRNMAYYDPSTVQRIKTIQALRDKRHLPLSEIKRLLGDASAEGSALGQLVMEAQRAALLSLTPPVNPGALTIPEAAKSFGMTAKRIEQLVELGLVSTKERDGKPVLTGHDLEVLAAIANLSKLGFNDKAGFTADDLKIYSDAMTALLQKEIETFLRVVSPKTRKGGVNPLDLARTATDGATMLLVAIRKKILADLLAPAAEP